MKHNNLRCGNTCLIMWNDNVICHNNGDYILEIPHSYVIFSVAFYECTINGMYRGSSIILRYYLIHIDINFVHQYEFDRQFWQLASISITKHLLGIYTIAKKSFLISYNAERSSNFIEKWMFIVRYMNW